MPPLKDSGLIGVASGMPSDFAGRASGGSGRRLAVIWFRRRLGRRVRRPVVVPCKGLTYRPPLPMTSALAGPPTTFGSATIKDARSAEPSLLFHSKRRAWVRGHWARLAGDGSLNTLM